MKGLPRVIPRDDLLQQVEGVESTLRWTRRAGLTGRIGLAVSAATVIVLFFTSRQWQALATFDWGHVKDHWPPAVAAVIVLSSLVLLNWVRFWVRVSRKPFRYTFSVADFTAIEGTEPQPRLAWLRTDLTKRLSERIGRLSLLAESEVEASERREAHIHVDGSYGIRQGADDRWAIEVVPVVRLGGTSAPATLGHSVRFALSGKDALCEVDGAVAYDKLLERVYFSIATLLYQQVRADVEQKIALLPKRYFRAAAYFYEADDYARSNTLDAYDAAAALYGNAIALYLPAWNSIARTRPQRLLQWIGGLVAKYSLAWRRAGARYWRRLGRVELLVARAEIGYANVLVDRRLLASFAGRSLNPVYAARPVAVRAVDRLRHRALADVPGLDDALFDGLVALASTLEALGAVKDADKYLREARQRLPAKAEQDPRYLYVRGRVVPKQGAQFFQRAAELAPTFEAAQFAFALSHEMLWRRRPTLEGNVAAMVADEYERVLRLNPGNIAAWANLGYMAWLLGDHERAELALERGREYKEIARETFVSELDYGLARVCAERGEFERAYRAYIDAVTALFGQGVSHAPDGYTAYHFEGMTPSILNRFEEYRSRVERLWKHPSGRGKDVSPRVRNSVYAFVLNDYGEACLNYFLRTGNQFYLGRAREVLTQAREELQTRYPMINYNLNRLQRWEIKYLDEQGLEAALRTSEEVDRLFFDTTYIERAIRYEPYWPDGLLEQAQSYGIRARQLAEAARVARKLAGEHQRKAKRLEDFTATAKADDYLLPEDYEPELPAAVELIEPTGPASPAPAVIPVPSTTELAGEKQSHVDERQRLEVLANSLQKKARAYRKSAFTCCERLLPHDWLQQSGHFDPVPALIRARRRWERDLDDLHVRALATWCEVKLVLRSAHKHKPRAERRPLYLPLLGKLGVKRARLQLVTAPVAAQFAPIWNLLQLLRQGFLPGRFDLLETCRTFPGLEPDVGRTIVQRERAIIEDTLERGVWWGLLALLEDTTLFPREEAVRIASRALDEFDLPVALYLTLGDMLRRLGQDSSAYEAYKRTDNCDDPNVLAAVAERLRELERWKDSLRWYEQAMKRRRAVEPGARLDRYRREIARTLWELGRYDEALEQLTQIQGAAEELGARWRTAFVRELIQHDKIGTPASYRLLKRWLGSNLTQGRRDSETRRDSAAALLLVTQRCYHPLLHRPLAITYDPILGLASSAVEPIVVEANAALFPEVREAELTSRLIDREIPELRAQMARELGIDLPPVRILRTATTGATGYRLYLRELPRESGEFRDDERFFVLNGAEVRRHPVSGRLAANPVDGQSGYWLSDAAPAQALGLEHWDRYTYMLQHVRSLVDRNLGFDDFEKLLAAWEQEADQDERRRLRESALPDESAHVRFAAVVRALAADRLPLVEVRRRLGEFLVLFRAAPKDAEVESLLERVHRALGPTLPGADTRTRLLGLPAELEEQLVTACHGYDGSRCVVLPQDQVEQLSHWLRTSVERIAREGDAVVVVVRPDVRRAVRYLTAQEDWSVPVVALGELPEARRLAVHETGRALPAGS